LGIALERKLIDNIDESVLNWFPEYSDLRTPEKERISLRHLLTMSAGLAWDEYLPYTDPKNSEVRMLMSSDQYRYILEQPVVSPPGQVWNYNSGGSALLGAVIGKATGEALDNVAREFLLEPLGITDFAWTKKAKSGIPEVGGPAAPRARLRQDWPACFGRRKLEWSPDRFTTMDRGIHRSPYWSCGQDVFLRLSMVARAFPVQQARGALDYCDWKWRTTYRRRAGT
jgi:CubicO group peptidase (beta-lactamase class C family)